MNERKRLIELIINADTYDSYECKLCTKDDDACDCCHAEKLADHLLTNGVIVPPCEVGDRVYMPWEWSGVKAVAYLTVTHIVFDRTKSYVKTDFHTDDEDYWSTYNCGEFAFSDFGKTVFLSREEAEKALKERSEKE